MDYDKDFNEWFEKAFPDHEDGCLYGKIALQDAWNNGSKKEKVEFLINYVLSDLKKIESLADLICNVKKDAEMMNCTFSETGGIIADLCFNLEEYLLKEYLHKDLKKLDCEVNE